MRNLVAILIFAVSAAGISYAAPPEVSEPKENREMSDTAAMAENLETIKDIIDNIELPQGEDSQSLKDLEKKFVKLESKYKGIEQVLQGIDEGYQIKELILSGDSVYIRLSDGRSFTFHQSEGIAVDNAGNPQNDIIGFGKTIVIREDEVIEGDVISAFGDVEVHGTVEGGVIALSGNIHISSTGKVENGVLAISGKVKRDQGSQVSSVIWGSHYDEAGLIDHNRSIYRYMALVFLIIYIIWFILTSTTASLMKSNVNNVIQYIKDFGVFKSFLMGYLAYCLAFLLFLGLIITFLGIPLAILGIPLALLAAGVLSSAAIDNIVGARILNSDRYTFRTYIYGNLILGSVPGLFFLVQLITGNLAIMVFSWIVIGIFIIIVIPVGLGAVLATRFGTRLRKKEIPASDTQTQS